MSSAVETKTFTPQRVATILTILAGVLTLVSWYLPWFTMHFQTAEPVEAPYVEIPSTIAQDPEGNAAWLVFAVGIALIVLGLIMISWRSPLATAFQTALTAGLALAIYPLLGTMAVFSIFSGEAASGVTLTPDGGVFLFALSFVLSVAAAIMLWRQVRPS